MTNKYDKSLKDLVNEVAKDAIIEHCMQGVRGHGYASHHLDNSWNYPIHHVIWFLTHSENEKKESNQIPNIFTHLTTFTSAIDSGSKVWHPHHGDASHFLA